MCCSKISRKSGVLDPGTVATVALVGTPILRLASPEGSVSKRVMAPNSESVADLEAGSQRDPRGYERPAIVQNHLDSVEGDEAVELEPGAKSSRPTDAIGHSHALGSPHRDVDIRKVHFPRRSEPPDFTKIATRPAAHGDAWRQRQADERR